MHSSSKILTGWKKNLRLCSYQKLTDNPVKPRSGRLYYRSCRTCCSTGRSYRCSRCCCLYQCLRRFCLVKRFHVRERHHHTLRKRSDILMAHSSLKLYHSFRTCYSTGRFYRRSRYCRLYQCLRRFCLVKRFHVRGGLQQLVLQIQFGRVFQSRCYLARLRRNMSLLAQDYTIRKRVGIRLERNSWYRYRSVHTCCSTCHHLEGTSIPDCCRR